MTSHLPIELVLVKKPFHEFTIDIKDNGASTGYSNTVHSYSHESLEYLGDDFVDVSPIPGKSATHRFKFKPLKNIRSYVVIKSGRSWDPKTVSYTGYVIVFN